MTETLTATSLLQLSREKQLTATCPTDWHSALAYAEQAYSMDEDATQKGRALAHIATILSNLGRTREAESYAKAFLRLANTCSDLHPYIPWVHRVLATVHYQRSDFAKATFYRWNALATFASQGNVSMAERTRINLAWSLCKQGHTRDAWDALPNTVSPEHEAIWHGACSLLLKAEGCTHEAIIAGELALQGSRASPDYVDGAEVALVLAGITGRSDYLRKATEFATRQAQNVKALLALNHRESGGDTPDKEGSRGSRNPHDGASFTTGVA